MAIAVMYGGMPDAMVAEVKHMPPVIELLGEARRRNRAPPPDFDLQDILTVVPELRNIPSGLQWLRVAIERLFVHLQVGIRLTNSAQ
jgi:hypothetical protein